MGSVKQAASRSFSGSTRSCLLRIGSSLTSISRSVLMALKEHGQKHGDPPS